MVDLQLGRQQRWKRPWTCRVGKRQLRSTARRWRLLCAAILLRLISGESSALGAAGDATIVLVNNGGSAHAATDSKDATNSKGVRAFSCWPCDKEDIVQNLVGEQIVDVPVPQIQDDGLQIVQERVLNRTPEQIVGVPVLQTMAPWTLCLLHHRNASKIVLRSRLWVSLCLSSLRLLWKLHHRNACRIARQNGSWMSPCPRSWRPA